MLMGLFRKSPIGLAIARIKHQQGQDVKEWVGLFDKLRADGKLSADVLTLIDAHAITPSGHPVNHYAAEISAALSSELRALAAQLSEKNLDSIVRKVVAGFVQKKSIFQCRDAHTEGGYYADAEKWMDWQWNKSIYPYVKDADLSSVLEIAPGHGRNSAKLIEIGAKSLHLVDVNETCINACRDRFGTTYGDCNVFFYVTNGDSIPFIKDESISFVYSFDSMVHFDKTIVRAYLTEFARVMKKGATGFIHHSNYGNVMPNSDWAKNIGNRSDMTAELFNAYCAEVGLVVTDQQLHGIEELRSIEALDCASCILKP
jgi:SAM-dependent methyltransferase